LFTLFTHEEEIGYAGCRHAKGNEELHKNLDARSKDMKSQVGVGFYFFGAKLLFAVDLDQHGI